MRKFSSRSNYTSLIHMAFCKTKKPGPAGEITEKTLNVFPPGFMLFPLMRPAMMAAVWPRPDAAYFPFSPFAPAL